LPLGVKRVTIVASQMTDHSSRDTWMWTGVGAVAGLAFLGLFSIGIFLLPILAALTLFAAGRTEGRGAHGVPVGAGLAIVAVTLPQPDFRALALAGLVVAASGVAACLAAARR
jgi:hypothetical protein